MERLSLYLAGDRELIAALKSLDDQLRRKVFVEANRAGLVILRDAIRERAPVKRGVLKRQIGIRGAKRRKYSTAARVTIGKAFWGAFVEKGHYQGKSHGSHKKKADYFAGSEGRKFIPAKPFIAPGFQAAKGQALAAMEHSLHAGVETAVRAARRN